MNCLLLRLLDLAVARLLETFLSDGLQSVHLDVGNSFLLHIFTSGSKDSIIRITYIDFCQILFHTPGQMRTGSIYIYIFFCPSEVDVAVYKLRNLDNIRSVANGSQ